MCTVTWVVHPDGYDVVFSRDEATTRANAEPPRVTSTKGVAVLAPRDPLAGGTWLSVNEHGLSLCVLNDYESVVADAAQRAKCSRGLLVRSLAGESSTREVVARVEALDLSVYLPFTLLVFEPGAWPLALCWNGGLLRQELAVQAPVTSSSYRPRLAKRLRRHAYAAFQRTRCAQLRADDLLNFHCSRWPLPSSMAVAMRRPGRETVSITHVSVCASQTRMRHYGGFPADHKLGRAEESHLDRRVAPAAAADRTPTYPPSKAFDLGAIFEHKSPALLARIPALALRLLAHVVRQDAINAALRGVGAVSPAQFPEACLRHLGVQAHVHGSALPSADALPIYVANHPLGALDGLALLAFVLRRHGVAIAPVNDVLCSVPQLAHYCVPLDRERDKRSMVHALARVFGARAPVLLFPAGRTSRVIDGRLQDHAWGKMVVTMARRQRRTIIPVYVKARNSRAFYLLAAARKALGIETNIEMFLLPHELLAPAFDTIELRVGAAISTSELLASGLNDRERVAKLRERCHALGQT